MDCILWLTALFLTLSNVAYNDISVYTFERVSNNVTAHSLKMIDRVKSTPQCSFKCSTVVECTVFQFLPSNSTCWLLMNLTLSGEVSINPTGLVTYRKERRITRTLVVSNGGDLGEWGPAQFCPTGSYATGYDMRIEPAQPSNDDTALNGILLYCERLKSSDAVGTVQIDGYWGDWGGVTQCNHQPGQRHYLKSFSLQVEQFQGSGADDTGANYVKFKCQDFVSLNDSYEVAQHPGEGPWGEYGDWSDSCGPNEAICGFKIKFEEYQGAADDTALNDLMMYCCA